MTMSAMPDSESQSPPAALGAQCAALEDAVSRAEHRVVMLADALGASRQANNAMRGQVEAGIAALDQLVASAQAPKNG